MRVRNFLCGACVGTKCQVIYLEMSNPSEEQSAILTWHFVITASFGGIGGKRSARPDIRSYKGGGWSRESVLRVVVVQSMAKQKSQAFARIRAEVIRMVAMVPEGKFTTYGSIATHMNVQARHVAFVLAQLTPEESERLPWHRVVASDGRISPSMPSSLSSRQRARLRAEGLRINAAGFIQDADGHYHYPGPRRNIRWSQVPDLGNAMGRPA